MKKWIVSCRGVEAGLNLVAIDGSQDMNAVDRARLVEAAPMMYEVCKEAERELSQLHAYHYLTCEGGCPTLKVISQLKQTIAEAEGREL